MNSTDVILRKSQLTGLLERVCQTLELTDTQFETAEARYEAVGKWLSEAEDRMLLNATIYPQGSISLSTTVKPIGQEEYDVDLVCLVPGLTPATSPAALKKSLGARLRQNARYADILEEKKRCWRLNYANEFHLDITPTIPNPACNHDGELLPDKRLVEAQLVGWRETNPKGYRRLFEERAKLHPRLRLTEAEFAEARGKVDSLPEPTQFKGILRRCVQLFKRHRDIWFSNRDRDLAPISIIITTLAAKSYEYCVTNNTFDTELDVLVAVLGNMPHFIDVMSVGDKEIFVVRNETTREENFADKWNTDSRLAQAFFSWHKAASADFERLVGLSGLDRIGDQLSISFGESISKGVLGGLATKVSDARGQGRLSVTPGVGLAIGSGRNAMVRPNTFFGK